jgi:aliphatic sulfonates family ABC transporter substrate-binding protein
MDRRTFVTVAAGVLAAPAVHAQQATPPRELRIGFQKSGVFLIAKSQGLLEKRLNPLGIGVKWTEFQFGPPLLEALNVGAIDYGPTGDSPPIFAQAARANLYYVAVNETAGNGAAILVPANSPIRTLADLKGKRVGFARASSSHNLTIAAIEKAGLQPADFTPIYLPPADARAAFERGSLDAWTIWDPFFAIAEKIPGTRILTLSTGVVAQNSYILANRAFTDRHGSVIAIANEELAKVADWASANRPEVSRLLAEATGIDIDSWTRAVNRTEFGVAPVSDRAIEEQQRVADRFHRLGLIPRPINVREIVWKWTPGT